MLARFDFQIAWCASSFSRLRAELHRVHSVADFADAGPLTPVIKVLDSDVTTRIGEITYGR